MKSIKDMFKAKLGALSLNQMPAAVMIIFFAAIIIGIAAYVLQEFQGKITENTTAYYAVNDSVAAIGDFASWMSIIVIVIAAAIIIGLIMLFKGSER